MAVDGPGAVWAGSESDFDAIILDVMLPGFDGFEVCRRLREAQRWAPVLMLTARDAVDDRIRGLDAGADDYLIKPFSFAELCARVRALLRRGSQERPPVLEAAGVRIDPARRLAWADGRLLDLSPRELALLELFVRRPGEVLTRTRILDQVWDFNWAGSSNVVDQYVGYLRRKLDRTNEASRIETVRGAGYRLRGEGIR